MGFGSKFILEEKHIYQKYNNGTTLFLAIIIFALPVFFIGMRTDFNDTYAYMQGFNNLSTSFSSLLAKSDKKGYGFIVYEWIIKKFITKDVNVFFMITATINASALIKLYYKYSTSFVYSVLLFFLSMSFTNMMGGIRQFLAVSLIIFASDYIFQKKFFKFLILMLLAYSIHATAIIWLFIFFLVQGKPWNPKIISIIILALLAVFMVDNFTNILSDALEGTDYEGYTTQFAKDDGSSIFHTLIAAVPAAIAFWKRKEIAEKNQKHIFVMVNCSIIAVLVSLLANFTSGILIGRFPIYLTLYNFALLPWMFENVFEPHERTIMKIACLAGYVCYAFYSINIVYGGVGMPYISSVLGLRIQ
ncbi:MAG: EpsG family protein [Oscillospiraceae bacterium]